MARVRKPQPQHFNAPKTCGGKYCYATRQQAELVVEEKQIIDPDLELTVYHCPSCRQFHLTRTKPISL